MNISIKHIDHPQEPEEDFRILMAPDGSRGSSEAKGFRDEWPKEKASSLELRRRLARDFPRRKEFRRNDAEKPDSRSEAISSLAQRARKRKVNRIGAVRSTRPHETTA